MVRSLAVALVVIGLSVSTSAANLRAVVPVVGSTEGAFGSSFRTSLQIHNRSTGEMRGSIVIHPAGVPASESDPTLPYVLAPRETISYEDVVAAAGLQGLGSMDIVVGAGGVPAIVVRAYDEKGDEQGTTGVSVAAVSPKDALAAGQSAALLVAPDLGKFRFNIGVRTLGDGVRMRVAVRDPEGQVRAELGELAFPAHYFVQRPASEILMGLPLAANESVIFEVIEGSVIVYGTTTDNTTNDPSLQIVRQLER